MDIQSSRFICSPVDCDRLCNRLLERVPMSFKAGKGKRVQQVGVTRDGTKVMTGAFFAVDSLGLPLTDVILAYEKHGWKVSMQDFYDSAIKAGWKERTVLGHIREALGEVYGPQSKECIDLWLDRNHTTTTCKNP